MSTILTRPSSSGSCASGSASLNALSVSGAVIIAPGVTFTVDSIPISDYIGARWLVRVLDVTAADHEGYEFFAFHNGVSTHYLKYAMLGPVTIAEIPTAVVSGGQLQFQIQNTGVNPLVVFLLRFPVPAIPNPAIVIPPGFSPTTRIAITSGIPALSTAIVDSVPALRSKGVKWIVEVYDATNNLVLAEEVFATTGIGTPVGCTAYSIIGDLTDISTDVTLTGPDAGLQLTNNTANAMLVSLTREELELPASLLPPTTCNSSAPSCNSSTECSVVVPFSQTTIPAGTTVSVDTINILGYLAAKWILVVVNPTAGTAEGYQSLMTIKLGSSPFLDSYGFIGDSIDHTLGFLQSGINLSLQVTNNEADSITVYLIQVPVSV